MNDSEQKMVDSENSDSPVMDKIMLENKISDSSADSNQNNLEVILDIPLEITIELGRTRMVINDLLKL